MLVVHRYIYVLDFGAVLATVTHLNQSNYGNEMRYNSVNGTQILLTALTQKDVHGPHENYANTECQCFDATMCGGTPSLRFKVLAASLFSSLQINSSCVLTSSGGVSILPEGLSGTLA